MTWVLPYSTADLRKNVDEYGAYYDSIEVCEKASRSHPKNAITKRNRSILFGYIYSLSDDALLCVEFTALIEEHQREINSRRKEERKELALLKKQSGK